ncbi:class I SAM-dependent methyltransferase [Sphingomonas sp. MM-1]|uniref:class I SAM-dependent methyltransferase n=1 Tax=Sphingomonas sp. MM-1 TaxID=745310 RepID=UPI0009FF9EB2|nr:class I SAM-dependent methyltransferase [Sphingomonas sp. MM-1]
MTRTPYATVAAQTPGADNNWFRAHPYDPPFLHVLSAEDHDILIAWLRQTSEQWPNSGASSIDTITMLTGLMMSSGIKRVVQCGHYVGFSTLLLGMIARRMGIGTKLYTVDIDPKSSAYTSSWLERAELSDIVQVAVRDSSDPICAKEAAAFLGGAPQLVYIDSSHQYDHTRQELELWWEALPPGGLLVMDDVSGLSADFDRTKKGGSHRAAMEFRSHTAPNAVILNSTHYLENKHPTVFRGVCGLGLFQKPYPFGG